MSKIILTIGISGSGKSTLARDMMTKSDMIRCNRDEIRKSLFGYDDEDLCFYYSSKGLAKREDMVTMVADGIIKSAIRHRKDVIVDNTHLKLKYLRAYEKFGVPIEYVLVDTPTNICIERDSKRKATVGEKVIKRQAKQLKELKQIFDFQTWFPENFTGNWTKIDERILWAKPDPNLPNAIIVDLDGTVALINGRSPFEGQKCHSDVVNGSVVDLLQKYHRKEEIILLSGRNSDKGGLEATAKWLIDNGIPFDHLIMREEGDVRKDTIVKKEMYEKFVKDKFNVIFVLDDRDMMIEMWRNELNLNCFQVHWGNF